MRRIVSNASGEAGGELWDAAPMMPQLQSQSQPTDRAMRGGRHGNHTVAEMRRRRAMRVAGAAVATVIVLIAALLGLAWARHRGPFADVPQANYSVDRWNLIVVNRKHRIPDNYPNPDLTMLAGGESVDSRIYPELQRMFDAARAQGMDPIVTAGYRTRAQQQAILDERTNEYVQQGMSRGKARKQAEETVALPGTSEHELGLAVDINAADSANAEANQQVYDWLAAHAWEYGFILRYPDGKTEVTGIAYEPWHYRYVGQQTAKAITEGGLVLEEYE